MYLLQDFRLLVNVSGESLRDGITDLSIAGLSTTSSEHSIHVVAPITNTFETLLAGIF